MIPWSEISPQLLAKYAVPVPRYTSYPTAPQWKDQLQIREHEAALTELNRRPGATTSMYVHLPFCRRRCHYCGCATWVLNRADDIEQYLLALDGELTALLDHLPNIGPLGQLHWGGGTPTTCSPQQLERIFALITEKFALMRQAEIAIELDPCVTQTDHIDTLVALGFNRVSMGVQDFTPEVQSAIGRHQTESATRKLFEHVRAADIASINFDLIYGLPLQDSKSWEANIKTVIDIGPDRLAVFGYAHVPWMRPHQKSIDEAQLPDTALRFELLKIAHDRLIDAGYVYIGMDHYARPTDELAVALEQRRLWRNFQGYTVLDNPNLIGVGVTAISDLAGTFAQNTIDLDDYIERTKSGQIPIQRGLVTTIDDRLRRHVITQLMCNLHIDIPAVESHFEISFKNYFAPELIALDELAADGVVQADDRSIDVTDIGRIFVRQVGAVFDRYLRGRQKDRPKFSKTV